MLHFAFTCLVFKLFLHFHFYIVYIVFIFTCFTIHRCYLLSVYFKQFCKNRVPCSTFYFWKNWLYLLCWFLIYVLHVSDLFIFPHSTLLFTFLHLIFFYLVYIVYMCVVYITVFYNVCVFFFILRSFYVYYILYVHCTFLYIFPPFTFLHFKLFSHVYICVQFQLFFFGLYIALPLYMCLHFTFVYCVTVVTVCTSICLYMFTSYILHFTIFIPDYDWCV